MRKIFSADYIYVGSEKKDYSILVEDGIIKAIDKRSLIREQFPFVKEERYDGFLYPGFNDAHLHIKEIALLLSSIDATNCKNFNDLKNLIQNSNDEFIYVYNLNFNYLSMDQWKELFNYNKPLFIQSKDEHSVFLNRVAILKNNIEIKEVKGGFLVKDKGKFIGIFKDKAIDLVKSVKERAISKNDIERVERYLLERGITSVTNFDFSVYPLLKEMDENGELRVRVYQGIAKDALKDIIKEGIRTNLCGSKLCFGPVKCFMDGSLGSQTAAMYSVKGFPNSFTMEDMDLKEIIELANRNNIQVAVHAIGDKAVHTVMELFKKFGNKRMRNRIEHLQFINENDLPLLKESTFIASMQPMHAISDAKLVKKLLGNFRYAYAWNTVLNSGKLLAFGSDAPVEDASPLLGIYAANKRLPQNNVPFIPEECISVKQAFDAYTIGSAFASFSENVKGKIENGYLADFVILDRSLFHSNVKDINVVKSIIGGENG